IGLEGAGVGEAERLPEALPGVLGVGPNVGLDAGGHLDRVLRAAEGDVPERDLLRLAVGDEARRAQPAEAVERALRAHPRLLAAPDELERLDEELGLADPAGAELEIPRGIDGELGARSLREARHLRGDAGIDAAAPDERREHAEELFAEGAIAGDGAG